MNLSDPANVEQMSASGDVQGLIDALAPQQPASIRRAAVMALGQLGGPDACQALVTALNDSDGYVRRAAVEALKLSGDLDFDECLIAALKDDFVDVRLAAASALGERHSEKAIKPLIILLLATEPFERKAATQALTQIGAPAVEPLMAALVHRQWLIREYAASILGNIGDARAIEPLITALKDPEAVVREAASRALGQIGAKLEDPDLRAHVMQSLNT